jgi:hypothetical protein
MFLILSRSVTVTVAMALLVACAGRAPAAQSPAAEAGCAPQEATAPPSQPALQPPAGSALTLRLHAEGAQIYTCKAGAGAAYAWVLKAPDARLYDGACKQVGTHSAGPTWRSSVDGSAVVAAKVADAPAERTIPWLLLKAQKNSGDGMFSRVTAIQRADTSGGVAPSSGCDASAIGHEQAVPYHANYYFYAPSR